MEHWVSRVERLGEAVARISGCFPVHLARLRGLGQLSLLGPGSKGTVFSFGGIGLAMRR